MSWLVQRASRRFYFRHPWQFCLAIAGISLGGYYAPRAAAFDKRIKACLALGGPFDWGECIDNVPDLTREACHIASIMHDKSSCSRPRRHVSRFTAKPFIESRTPTAAPAHVNTMRLMSRR